MRIFTSKEDASPKAQHAEEDVLALSRLFVVLCHLQEEGPAPSDGTLVAYVARVLEEKKLL